MKRDARNDAMRLTGFALLLLWSAASFAAPPQWLPATRLSLDGAAARSVQTAAVGGRVLAVWTADPLGARTLFARESRDRGETWGPTQLVFPPGAERTEPSLTADGADFWLAWTQPGEAGGAEIRVSRLAETGWTEPTLAAAGPALSRPRLALTRSLPRAAAVAFEDRSGAFPRAMWTESLIDAGGWSAPRPLGDPSAPSAQPDIAAEGGAFHLVWQDFRAPQPHIYYVYRGRSAAAAERRLSLLPGARAPFIAARGNRLLAGWESRPDGGGPNIAAAVAERADQTEPVWSGPVRLTDSATQSAQPTGAVWSEGAALFWQDGRSGRFDLYAAFMDENGVWGEPFAWAETPLPSTRPSAALPYGASAEASAGGQIQLTWMENGAALHSGRDTAPPDAPSRPESHDLSANPGWDDDGTLLFRWSAAPGAVRYEAVATVNGAEAGTYSTAVPSLELTGMAGAVSAAARAVDAVGNVSALSPASAPARVDAQPPLVRIDRPVPDEELYADARIRFSCEEAFLKSCVAEYGEGENPSVWTPLAEPFAEPFESAEALFSVAGRQGAFTFRVRAEDAAGNRSEAVVRAYVDRSEPPAETAGESAPLWSEPSAASARRSVDWSPEARRIAYISDEFGAPDVWTARLDGSDAAPIAADPFLDADPAWRPDGRAVAYASLRDGAWQIAVRNLETGAETILAPSPFRDREPAWSPDGGQLAFTSDRSGRDQIYRIENAAAALNGAEPIVRRAARSGGSDRRPRWRPNGAEIAYESNAGGVWNIWTADLYGSEPRPLIPLAGARAPRFMDGKRILFTRFLNGAPSLWIWSAVSGSARRITPLGLDAQFGVWADGAALFESNGDLMTAPLTAPTPILEARIASPRKGSVVSGTVPVFGAARGTRFESYTLEYSPADGSAAPVSIAGVSTSPVEPGGFLGEWSAEGLTGEYRLLLTAYGADGSAAASEAAVSILPPSAELDIWEPGDGSITLNAEARLRGRARGSLSVNGETLPTDEGGAFDALYPLQPGENRLSFRLEDRAGRWTVEERTVTRQTAPFVLQLDAPSEFQLLNAPYARVTGSAPGAASVWVNGKEISADAGGRFSRWTPVPLEGGEIAARAVDAFGREASAKRWVGVQIDDPSAGPDAVPPALLDHTPPLNAVWNAPRPIFEAAVADNRPLEGVRLTVHFNGEEAAQNDWEFDAETGRFRFSPPYDLLDGEHLLLVEGADAAGNALLNGEWRVEIDSVPLLTRLALIPSPDGETALAALAANRPLDRIERAQLLLGGQEIGAPIRLNRIASAQEWEALSPYAERGTAQIVYAAVLETRGSTHAAALLEARGPSGERLLISGLAARGSLRPDQPLTLRLRNGVEAEFAASEIGGGASIRSLDGLDADLTVSQWRDAAERGMSADDTEPFGYLLETTAPEAELRLSAPYDPSKTRAWMVWEPIRRRWIPPPPRLAVRAGGPAAAALLEDAQPPYLTRAELPSSQAGRFYFEAELADDGSRHRRGGRVCSGGRRTDGRVGPRGRERRGRALLPVQPAARAAVARAERNGPRRQPLRSIVRILRRGGVSVRRVSARAESCAGSALPRAVPADRNGGSDLRGVRGGRNARLPRYDDERGRRRRRRAELPRMLRMEPGQRRRKSGRRRRLSGPAGRRAARTDRRRASPTNGRSIARPDKRSAAHKAGRFARDGGVGEGSAPQYRFSAAMLFDQGALIRPSAGVRRLRVQDRTQPRLQRPLRRPMLRIARQILGLLRVVPQMEQQRRVSDMINVLIRPLPNHETSAERADRVVFAQRVSFGRASVGNRPKRFARQVRFRFARGDPQSLQDGRVRVRQRHDLRRLLPRRRVRTRQDERNRRRLFVHRELAEKTAAAEAFAVVAGIDDARRFSQTRAVERIHHAPYLPVEMRACAVVGGGSAAQLLLCERLFVSKNGAEPV